MASVGSAFVGCITSHAAAAAHMVMWMCASRYRR
jgi:hypothetical protein